MNMKRFLVLAGAFVIISSFLSARLMYISVFKNDEYTDAVDFQQTNVVSVGKVRGDIYDRNGIALTGTEEASYGITRDGEVTSGDEGVIRFSFVPRYGEGSIASHIIGYTNSDGNGVCGIEKLCNEYLKSDDEIAVSFKGDAIGRPFEDTSIQTDSDSERKTGRVWLTLDSKVQKIVEDVMDKSIAKGAAVILDTKTFEVIAMASRPDFDRGNPYSFFGRPDAPLLNRCLCEYNAGSVFKIAVGGAYLDNNIENTDKMFFCEGFLKDENQQVFRCHKEGGHGELDFKSAFAASCNCVFYEAGISTGGEKICQMAEKLGFARKHLALAAEEAAGILPHAQSYTNSQLMNISIGQGDVMITPLQCAVMTATVANGGIRKNVRLINGIGTVDGKINFVPCDSDETKAMEESTAIEIGKMMRECVLSGTGSGASVCSVAIAGKTGTAETGWLNEEGKLLQHGWFCGFFPYESPRYAMAILCEDGKSGAGSCVEPFVEICDKINEINCLKE